MYLPAKFEQYVKYANNSRLLITLSRFHTFSGVSIVEFKQVNASWVVIGLMAMEISILISVLT